MVDGEPTFLTGDLQPTEGQSIHDQIEATGAPALLLERYAGRLEYHAPWHPGARSRTCSAAWSTPREAERAAREPRATPACGWSTTARSRSGLRTYHLSRRASRRPRAVAAHMRARGYAPEDCIGVGDSPEDLDVAAWSAGSSWSRTRRGATARRNVERTEAAMSEGFYEAVVRAICRVEITSNRSYNRGYSEQSGSTVTEVPPPPTQEE